MDPSDGEEGPKRFIDFPYVAAPYRDLMVDLVSTVDMRLGNYLLPPKLPPEVHYYRNQANTAHASLHIRSAIKPSPIDFILGSWLHCQLPTGGALNILSLSTYLSSSTDAPNFFMDLILSSPTSLVFVLDIPPRRDLVLHPDYLKIFYEDTQLDKHRQSLLEVPEVQPYFSPSLYVRSLVSPTAVLVRINTGEGGCQRMEEIVRDHVGAVVREVFGVWSDKCACGERAVSESDGEYLVKRDLMVKDMSVEIDLGTSLPRMFGQEVADKILGVIKEVFYA